jgi:putative ABC transport system substrate-binding protein
LWHFSTVHALQRHGGALVIGADPFFTGRSQQLAALTLRHGVPTITQYREFAAAGGLMSYGGSFTEAGRQVGVYSSVRSPPICQCSSPRKLS